jgi:hypothetical protein
LFFLKNFCLTVGARAEKAGGSGRKSKEDRLPFAILRVKSLSYFSEATMLATFAFDVCHDVYRAAREAIDEKIPTLNVEAAGKYSWRPDRMPRLAEFVCDFARAGERALGEPDCLRGRGVRRGRGNFGGASEVKRRQAEACPTFRRAHLLVLFRVYYLGGAEYSAARRHMGISEITWGDWSEEIRGSVGKELMKVGVFPPARYFRESTAA